MQREKGRERRRQQSKNKKHIKEITKSSKWSDTPRSDTTFDVGCGWMFFDHFLKQFDVQPDYGRQERRLPWARNFNKKTLKILNSINFVLFAFSLIHKPFKWVFSDFNKQTSVKTSFYSLNVFDWQTTLRVFSFGVIKKRTWSMQNSKRKRQQHEK